MELTDKQVGTSAQSWLSRVERRRPNQVDYFSGLRSWVHHAILEAEKKKDFNKKGKLLNLLEDLQERPKDGFKMEMTRRKE